MALTGRRPAEIFFSASFSLPKKKLPFPGLIFEGQLPAPASHALKHHLRGEPQSLYTAYFADAIEAIRADSQHPDSSVPN
jgi:hypothetical protein